MVVAAVMDRPGTPERSDSEKIVADPVLERRYGLLYERFAAAVRQLAVMEERARNAEAGLAEAKRLVAHWLEAHGREQARAARAERNEDTAMRERDNAVWERDLHVSAGLAADERAAIADEQNIFLASTCSKHYAAFRAAEARAVELADALREIARGGTDYSPGYGGSWASRVARSVLAEHVDSSRPGTATEPLAATPKSVSGGPRGQTETGGT